jgi:hypothetical protein
MRFLSHPKCAAVISLGPVLRSLFLCILYLSASSRSLLAEFQDDGTIVSPVTVSIDA